MKLLNHKNSIITGANRGIGLETLKIFAQNGSNVWACIRKPSNNFSEICRNLEEETGVIIKPIFFDLKNREQIKSAVKEIKQSKKNIDILVNNAGKIFTALFQMTAIENFEDTFNINFFSQMIFTQFISRQMMKQKSGNIINLSSSAAIEANRGRLAYASSKAAIITSTKVMAKELGPYNIRVNAVAPGLTNTDMMIESTEKEAMNKTINDLCIKRCAEPEEIANSILFLASDLSSYVTSQVLRVDGGM